jgi:hypothetical protein
MENMERQKGQVAKSIEKETSKIPSDVFLWGALGSMAISLVLKVAGKKSQSLFVGQWTAPFLILGLYNKLVKLESNDKDDKGRDVERKEFSKPELNPQFSHSH